MFEETKTKDTMKLFPWARPKSDVVLNDEVSQMTMPQLRERIVNQRNVINAQRELMARQNRRIKNLEKTGESIVNDIMLIKAACENNYDQLPEDVQTLIEKS